MEHSRYKEPLQFKTARDVSYVRKNNHAYLYKLRQTNSASQRINKIPVPQLRRNPNEKRREMPQIRQNIQMPKMWIPRTIKGEV